jgi:hypothetical protein
MASKEVLEEVKNFIRFAVKNRANRSEDEKNWSAASLEDYDQHLIEILLGGIGKRKTDRALCEYAQLISKSKGVPLPESIGFRLLLFKI